MDTTAIDALMRHAIDYAGIFPPAELSVAEAVAAYVRVRDGAQGWVLGTFVVSSDRLHEVRNEAIPLSVVMRQSSASAVADVMRAADRLKVVALEFPPVPAQEIPAAVAAAPPHVRLFFEVAPDGDSERSLDAIAAAGALAKIRTGGVTAAAFPEAAAVDRFFRACVARRLACKATAGLHHAVSGRYPLTYESGSASSSMYGFLNIAAAAALVYIGAPEVDVIALLEESSPETIGANGDALTWRDYRVSARDIETMRRSLFSSFGSCSAQEPVDDLVRMHLA